MLRTQCLKAFYFYFYFYFYFFFNTRVQPTIPMARSKPDQHECPTIPEELN